MKNRYIDRYVAAFLFVFLNMAPAVAQVTLKGPSEGKVGHIHKIAVTDYTGQDLKVEVTKTVFPDDDTEITTTAATENDWTLVKDANDRYGVWLTPDQNGVYVVTAATNHEGKTYTHTHVVVVGRKPKPKPPAPPTPNPAPPTPNPSPPVPDTPKSKFVSDVAGLYRVSPDATALASIIDIFTTVKSQLGGLHSYGDLETVLANTANRKLNDTVLRSVRDRISKYMLDTTGPDPRKWDQKVAEQLCDDIVSALKAVQ